MMEVQAQTITLTESPSSVSAIRSWWQEQQQAERVVPAPIPRPRIRLKSSITEVRCQNACCMTYTCTVLPQSMMPLRVLGIWDMRDATGPTYAPQSTVE